ncbi:MAG: type VI secretion system lipoprotein TssJ [Alphaproteobacteria bacterium]|nr:MAG: type VI secretion system lipoprotein TssJ [Alphaproteobacteria bacterium]
MKRNWFAPIAMLAMLVLAACGPSAPEPTRIALGISTSPDMNGGAPARIQVFYLKGPGGFSSADFFSLSQNAVATLGADLASQAVYTVNPGSSQQDAASIPQPVTHVGVIVGFRNIGSSVWRGIVAVKPNAPNSVSIEVSAAAVNVIAK